MFNHFDEALLKRKTVANYNLVFTTFLVVVIRYALCLIDDFLANVRGRKALPGQVRITSYILTQTRIFFDDALV